MEPDSRHRNRLKSGQQWADWLTEAVAEPDWLTETVNVLSQLTELGVEREKEREGGSVFLNFLCSFTVNTFIRNNLIYSSW